jgi:hypothetical protein
LGKYIDLSFYCVLYLHCVLILVTGITSLESERALKQLVAIPYIPGARWSRDQSVWRAIAEAKLRSQRAVIGWVTKIYYLDFLRASIPDAFVVVCKVPTPVSRRVIKTIAESLLGHDENMLYRSHLVVGKRSFNTIY